MGFEDQRANKRFALTIRATVVDPVKLACFPCVIRDGSVTGCRILCDQINDLPDNIGLEIPPIERIIEGRVVWRTDKAAGIAFDWEKTQRADDSPVFSGEERRRAPRQQVNLPAIVLDRENRPVVSCTICDISRTGCRIVISDNTVIPSKIRFEVENLLSCVTARVVWRKDNLAGTEFVAEDDVYVLEDEVVAQPADAQHEDQT